MLPDRQLRLLTAAVDGELSPAEDRALRKLLFASDPARTTFARLQADRARVGALPPAVPPADFRARVMARLPHATPAPSRPVTVPSVAVPVVSVRGRPWVPLAVAASLLLVVTSGSFWYFVRQDDAGRTPGGNAVARADRPNPEPTWTEVLPRENAPPPSTPAAEDPFRRAAADATVPPVVADPPDVLPPPRLVDRDVNAFPPLLDLPPLNKVQVRVPFLAAVADFDRDDVRQRFADDLGRDPAVRIDLFVKDAGRGAEAFQAAAKAGGVAVAVDAATAERVKRKQATAYLVYAESLTPADLRDLFARLAADDAKAAVRVFDSVHVTPAGPVEQKELKDVLGTDPGLWKRPAHTPAPAEPKSISSGTGDQVAKALTTPPAKTGEKPALLMTFSPAAYRTNPAASREVKQFFDRRGERKPAAVPVLVVIRQIAG